MEGTRSAEFVSDRGQKFQNAGRTRRAKFSGENKSQITHRIDEWLATEPDCSLTWIEQGMAIKHGSIPKNIIESQGNWGLFGNLMKEPRTKVTVNSESSFGHPLFFFFFNFFFGFFLLNSV